MIKFRICNPQANTRDDEMSCTAAHIRTQGRTARASTVGIAKRSLIIKIREKASDTDVYLRLWTLRQATGSLRRT